MDSMYVHICTPPRAPVAAASCPFSSFASSNTMRRSLDVSSVLSSDDLADYDVISDGHQSLESSIADLGHVDRSVADIREPSPLQAAKDRFDTIDLSADDIQGYVQRLAPWAVNGRRNGDGEQRMVRVYVDGVFDPFQARDALQLRQAKLSFPSVHLMVGIFADDLCERHNTPIWARHIDRCEVLRHCRWVDEVLPDAPWTLDEQFLRAKKIDFVAIDEGSSVNPACDKDRLRGYDLVKGLRKAIPTRRTTILTPPEPASLSPFIESSSTRGTIKGTPPPLPTELMVKDLKIEDDTPFGEPKLDEFGTGSGV